jgi:hypothetical protein
MSDTQAATQGAYNYTCGTCGHGRSENGLCPNALCASRSGTQAAAPTTPEAREALEAERQAFKRRHKHLDVSEVPDAWGRPSFKHPHVESIWLGWITRATLALAAPAEGQQAVAPGDSRSDSAREALRGLWPLIDKQFRGLVFTGDRAGEVQALINILRAFMDEPPAPTAPDKAEE